MAKEIERKFLVNALHSVPLGKGELIQQGYLAHSASSEVRVRIKSHQAFLTIKSSQKGMARSEFEYLIPVADAEEMIKELCENTILKTRYQVEVAPLTWEIDIFEGKNQGLILAEVELQSATQHFEKPHWVADEVTEDSRYYNAHLAGHPFQSWPTK